MNLNKAMVPSFQFGPMRQATTDLLAFRAVAETATSNGGHGEKKQRVVEKLGTFFERFFELIAGGE
jgi:type I restriction enzyme, R subunit